jgi:plasmid stability protein
VSRDSFLGLNVPVRRALRCANTEREFLNLPECKRDAFSSDEKALASASGCAITVEPARMCRAVADIEFALPTAYYRQIPMGRWPFPHGGHHSSVDAQTRTAGTNGSAREDRVPCMAEALACWHNVSLRTACEALTRKIFSRNCATYPTSEPHAPAIESRLAFTPTRTWPPVASIRYSPVQKVRLKN